VSAVVAHIGKVPVEEWLPFLVPVLLLYLYGRRESRRRRQALRRLPDVSVSADDRLTEQVLARWAGAGHRELSREHVPLFLPPGIEGASIAETVARLDASPGSVERLLLDLAELGYVELDDSGGDDRRAWLTADGYQLAHAAEDTLLAGRHVEGTGS
jgi:DNA-binding transcriptional ArsR family regulator